MTLILIIGVLIPIIYIMRLNIKQKTIRLKETLNTVLLSIVGICLLYTSDAADDCCRV